MVNQPSLQRIDWVRNPRGHWYRLAYTDPKVAPQQGLYVIWPDRGSTTTIEAGEGDVRARLLELSGRCSASWFMSWVPMGAGTRRSGMARYLIDVLKPGVSRLLRETRPVRCNTPHG